MELRKTINVLTLIVMMSVNVFTPFSYADVESGDLVDIEQPTVEEPVVEQLVAEEPLGETPEKSDDSDFMSWSIIDIEVPEEGEKSIEVVEPELPVVGSGDVISMSWENDDVDDEHCITELSGWDNNVVDEHCIAELSGWDNNVVDEHWISELSWWENNMEIPEINGMDMSRSKNGEVLLDSIDVSELDSLSWLDLYKNELEIMENPEMYTITFDVNWWESKESVILTWWLKLEWIIDTEYSYTKNLSSDWTKNSDYGNNWNDNNIVNKIITITWADYLEVTITYWWEWVSSDWACIYEWNHPEYTASDYLYSLSDKLWWKNNTKIFNIDWDTVTFSFKSDYSKGWYWYYAVVKWIQSYIWDNPVKENSIFQWWYKENWDKWDIKNDILNSDITLYAGWKCNIWFKESESWEGCEEKPTYFWILQWDDDDMNDFEYKTIEIWNFIIILILIEM